MGAAADHNLLVDTRAAGHLLSAPQGFHHFLHAARQAAAEGMVLDPLYSTHHQDENDTRSMAALCQSLQRLRDASHAALIVFHHVRKSSGRYEIGSARADAQGRCDGAGSEQSPPLSHAKPHRRLRNQPESSVTMSKEKIAARYHGAVSVLGIGFVLMFFCS